MPRPPEDQARPAKSKWTFAFVLLGLLAAMVAVWLIRSPAPPPRVETPVALVTVSRTNLVLLAGCLCLSGQTNAFSGLMIEHAPDGSLRSRSSISNGLLHGISEGWHTNGQIQIREHFQFGISHGQRIKYYADGSKMSEATVIEGKLAGTFQRWHPNGQLAEIVELRAGVLHGTSKSYFPSGFLKIQARLQDGKVIESESWKDGEFQISTADSTALH